MKTEKKGVEGQLDIFEAMNRAADAIDRMKKTRRKRRHPEIKQNPERSLQKL